MLHCRSLPERVASRSSRSVQSVATVSGRRDPWEASTSTPFASSTCFSAPAPSRQYSTDGSTPHVPANFAQIHAEAAALNKYIDITDAMAKVPEGLPATLQEEFEFTGKNELLMRKCTSDLIHRLDAAGCASFHFVLLTEANACGA